MFGPPLSLLHDHDQVCNLEAFLSLLLRITIIHINYHPRRYQLSFYHCQNRDIKNLSGNPGPEPVDIDLMYSFGRKSGLPLQPRFRTVRHVQKGSLASFLELVGTSHIDSNVILIGFSVTCCCSCYDHFDDRCVALVGYRRQRVVRSPGDGEGWNSRWLLAWALADRRFLPSIHGTGRRGDGNWSLCP